MQNNFCATEPNLECAMLRSYFNEGQRVAFEYVSNTHLKKALLCADLVAGFAQKKGTVSDDDVGAVYR
jgi:hypothetical protein